MNTSKIRTKTWATIHKDYFDPQSIKIMIAMGWLLLLAVPHIVLAGGSNYPDAFKLNSHQMGFRADFEIVAVPDEDSKASNLRRIHMTIVDDESDMQVQGIITSEVVITTPSGDIVTTIRKSDNYSITYDFSASHPGYYSISVFLNYFGRSHTMAFRYPNKI